MWFSPRRRVKATFDITPLVDCVLLLLIFFMLTSSFVFQPGIKVDLPKAATTEPNIKKELVVLITKEGNLFFREQRITLKAFKALLKKEIAANKKAFLIISADKEALHGRVVEVMDTAKLAGIERIAIAALAKEAKKDKD
jgi:biopolymer transport protein ExbD